MGITTIDFETYFGRQFSLKKLSIPEYVHDPWFHVHGLAVRWPNRKAEFFVDVPQAIQRLQARFGKDLESTTVVCHNAYFDLYVLNHKYGVTPRFFIDPKSLAYHVHGRRGRGGEGQDASLRALAELYGLEAKGDLDFMCGVRDPNAQQLAKLKAYAEHDVNLTAQLAERLLPQIARPEVELPLLMHTVRLFSERAIEVDVSRIDVVRREILQTTVEFLREAQLTPEMVKSDKSFLPLLTSALECTGRSVPMKDGARGLIPATAKTDPEMQKLAMDRDPAVAALAQARLMKRGDVQKLARLDKLRRITKATGGKVPPYLVYCGCHTGRFAGGGGLNLQNLGREGLGGEIRKLLVPKPGHVFVIADFAQNEARITAYYAGEKELLSAFKEQQDIYSEFAAHVFGRLVRKPRDSDPLELKQALGALRQVGKAAILGLGFSMGALTFMDKLREKPEAAALFDKGELTPLRCRGIVKTFRRRYHGIQELWGKLERAARLAIDGVGSQVGKINVARDHRVTHFILPSGRSIRYENLRLDATPRTIKYLDKDGNESEFTSDEPAMVYGRDTDLYGGKLCENVVQATARDLLVEALLRLEDRGLRVLFHVHDEAVIEVAEDAAEESVEAVREEFIRGADWAPELPLACDVRIAREYGK